MKSRAQTLSLARWAGLLTLVLSGGCGDDVPFDPNMSMGTASAPNPTSQNPGNPTTPSTATTSTPGASTSTTTTSEPDPGASTPSTEDPGEGTETKKKDCVGVDPENPDGPLWFAPVQAPRLSSLRQDCKEPACVGSAAPFWQLHDYQPLSCGYNQDYGIADFKNRTVFVALLSGW